MQGDHKEQHLSHSLNRWKQRSALRHRHAGMLTGSEPYILRGILSKGVRALMTRLGPSHERGPGTQPHKIVSEFSVCIHHTTFHQCYNNVFNQVSVHICYTAFYQCVQSREGQTNINKECSISQYNIIIMCSIERKTIPSDRAMALILSMHIIWWHNIEGDNLPLLWYLGNWGNQVFCEFFHTHTLRLVSPWECPGNPAYPLDCHTA